MSEFSSITVLGEEIGVKDVTARNGLTRKIGWSDTNKIKDIHFDKIVDSSVILPNNYVAQGFAIDSSFYYMYFYQQGGGGLLRKIRRSDNAQVASAVTEMYHGNNITLTPNGSKLLLTYNTDPTGANVQTVGVYSTSDLALIGTFNTGNVTYACGVTQRDGIDTMVYGISNSRALGIKTKVADGSYALTEYITLNDAPNGLKQGMHLGSFIYMPESYFGITKNAIKVFDYSGTHMITLYPNIETEIEDVSRVSGEEYLYCNDSFGNIYRSEDTTGFFHTPFVDSINSNYVQCTPRIICSHLWGQDDVYNVNGQTIPRTIKCNPAFKRATNQLVTGTFYFDGLYMPVCYSPISGSISVRGVRLRDYVNGGILFNEQRSYDITYKYDETTNTFTLEHLRVMYIQQNTSTGEVSTYMDGGSESGSTLEEQVNEVFTIATGGNLTLLQAVVGANVGNAVSITPF